MSFAGKRFVIEMASHMGNGAVKAVELVLAEGFLSVSELEGNTATPHAFAFGVERGYPSF
jgi:hypothetical protein